MDKQINDNDRIVIGVREWAVAQVLQSSWSGWFPEQQQSAGAATKAALELEAYVLRNIATESGTDSPEEKI